MFRAAKLKVGHMGIGVVIEARGIAASKAKNGRIEKWGQEGMGEGQREVKDGEGGNFGPLASRPVDCCALGGGRSMPITTVLVRTL